MSRKSQTELAVLGALAVEPATGYGVRQAITQTLGHFWQESFGQIYPCLADLERLIVALARHGVRVLLLEVLKNNADLPTNVTFAYESTLRKYHNFIVRGIFSVSERQGERAG